MKITRSQLTRIIKEEVENILLKESKWDEIAAAARRLLGREGAEEAGEAATRRGARSAPEAAGSTTAREVDPDIAADITSADLPTPFSDYGPDMSIYRAIDDPRIRGEATPAQNWRRDNEAAWRKSGFPNRTDLARSYHQFTGMSEDEFADRLRLMTPDDLRTEFPDIAAGFPEDRSLARTGGEQAEFYDPLGVYEPDDISPGWTRPNPDDDPTIHEMIDREINKLFNKENK